MLLLFTGLLSFLEGGVSGTLVLFSLRALHSSELGYGVLLTCGAAGSLAGGLCSPWLAQVLGVRAALFLAVLVGGLAYPAVSITTSVALACLLFAVNDMTVPLWNVVASMARQVLVPDAYLGRASAAFRTLAYGLLPLGAVAGGGLATAAGVAAPLRCAGLMIAASSVLCLLLPARETNRLPVG
ncbi:hypothetical protein GCM10010170_024280 [Dactylosporangium salmoneum]|uniref:MFS transporter n=1 Tax=Dactylosporangium salmoneum TaxID=53361 RepID=A0ABN3FZK4_9ACTN